ncbi:hypothetical protein KY313_01445 [Candidatus Woesearchaeota archaeon]|jgi:glycogen debranching enzyme|nr:hypothetical protein [Candidatus Woesearchaeota archaeon]
MHTIIHEFDNIKLKKVSYKTPSFLLSNKKGNFFSLPLSHKPISRFQGLHICVPTKDSWEMHKIIENIYPKEVPLKLVNKLLCFERHYKNAFERFSMPDNNDALIYETKNLKEITLSLDMRPIYDFHHLGRNYSIKEYKDYLLITYTRENYKLYLAIAHNGIKYNELNDWTETAYISDKKRNSHPYKLYIYRALKLFLKSDSILSFSASFSKNEAIRNAKSGLKNLNKPKRNTKTKHKVNLNLQKETKAAYLNSINSLNHLTKQRNNKQGIFAGLPWFFQFWSRDEAISLKALMLTDQKQLAKKILLRQLSTLKKDGRIPNIFPNSKLSSADGIGWMVKRFSELNISKKSTEAKKIKRAINLLLKHHTKNGLTINSSQETWMDTKHTPRSGFRIEIQALRLSAYKFLFTLTNEKKYQKLESELKDKVKQKFWNHPILADGFNHKHDFTIRPNIFLAYYIYSALLTKEEWKICFSYALRKLWLNWGGIATINKHHPSFKDTYSGENPESYHNGDSWYFINNITAICLNRLDKKLYKKYINKILKSSTDDILYNGFIGHASELSSAKEFSSEASLCQAWSAATYIELIHELFF